MRKRWKVGALGAWLIAASGWKLQLGTGATIAGAHYVAQILDATNLFESIRGFNWRMIRKNPRVKFLEFATEALVHGFSLIETKCAGVFSVSIGLLHKSHKHSNPSLCPVCRKPASVFQQNKTNNKLEA